MGDNPRCLSVGEKRQCWRGTAATWAFKKVGKNHNHSPLSRWFDNFSSHRMISSPFIQRLITSRRIAGRMSRTKIIQRIITATRARNQMVSGCCSRSSTQMTYIAIACERRLGHAPRMPPVPPRHYPLTPAPTGRVPASRARRGSRARSPWLQGRYLLIHSHAASGSQSPDSPSVARLRSAPAATARQIAICQLGGLSPRVTATPARMTPVGRSTRQSAAHIESKGQSSHRETAMS